MSDKERIMGIMWETARIDIGSPASIMLADALLSAGLVFKDSLKLCKRNDKGASTVKRINEDFHECPRCSGLMPIGYVRIVCSTCNGTTTIPTDKSDFDMCPDCNSAVGTELQLITKLNLNHVLGLDVSIQKNLTI